MKNPMPRINWFSANLSLKILSVGMTVMVLTALLLPQARDFILGMAISWSGLLVFQIFKLKPLPDIEVDRDPMTQLHLQ